MNLVIRAAQPADLDAILVIAEQCPEAPRWPLPAWSAFLAPAGTALLRTAFIVESAREPIGFAAATLLLDGQENRCELDSMAVRPDARKQGAGTALLQAILAWAAERGAHRVALEVRAGNVAALRLYQRMGLGIKGRRPRYYADPEEDALLLDMPVTNGRPSGEFSTSKLLEGERPRC